MRCSDRDKDEPQHPIIEDVLATGVSVEAIDGCPLQIADSNRCYSCFAAAKHSAGVINPSPLRSYFLNSATLVELHEVANSDIAI